jgi:hypothetical protein
LWKETVNLEDDPEDARILLTRAVEVIPNSVELWLTLARLETPENAKKVLNSARNRIPTSHEIWIAAGRLAEQSPAAVAEVKMEDDSERIRKLAAQVDKLMAGAVASLKRNQVILSREQWLQEAERCEAELSPLTAQAIVKATIHLDVEEEDRRNVWLEDAERAEKGGFFAVARACFVVVLETFPSSPSVWRKAAEFEKAHGTPLVMFTPQLATLTPYLDRQFKIFSRRVSSIARMPKCYGSWRPRRSGCVGMLLEPRRSLVRRSSRTKTRSLSSWLQQNLLPKLGRWMLLCRSCRKLEPKQIPRE